MPKQKHHIRNFKTGTITSASQVDIPEDSASYGYNVDPLAREGTLSPLNKDHILTSEGLKETGTATPLKAESLKVINDNGTGRLIACSKDENNIGTISKVDDFWGSEPVKEDLSTTVQATSFTMESNNKEVHIGTGDSNHTYPKWAGIISHEQFGTTYPGVQLEDARINSPMSFPSMDKVVTDNTYMYGFSKDYNEIFRFSMTDEPELIDSTVVDCEKIIDIDLVNEAADGSADPNTASSRIFAVVEKLSDDIADENYEAYRIKEFDYELNEVKTNIKFEATVTENNYDGDGNNITRPIYCGSSTSNGLVPLFIKVTDRGSNNIEIWLVFEGYHDYNFGSFPNNYYQRSLETGNYIMNSGDINPSDGDILTLTLRTPAGLHKLSNENATLPNVGFVAKTSDTTNEFPAHSTIDEYLNVNSMKVLSVIQPQGVDDGGSLGFIVASSWADTEQGGASDNGGSRLVLKVKNDATASNNEYVRIKVLYIIIKRDFNTSTTFFQGAASTKNYQAPALFTTNLGSSSLSTSDCMIYHFGLKPKHNVVTRTHSSSGGWAYNSYRIGSSREIVQSIYVNPYPPVVLDQYGTCSINPILNGVNSDTYYIRKFANPNISQASIGWDNTPGTDLGHVVTLADETETVKIINAHYIPKNRARLFVLFGRSNTEESELGIYDAASGSDWWDSNLTYEKHDGSMLRINATSITNTSTFANSTRYFYKVSFIYDGYQESSLTPSIHIDSDGDATGESFEISVQVSASVNKRVSHVVIYRADSGTNTDALKPTGFYRQVAYIPLSDPKWSIGSVFNEYIYLDTNDINGISYEASSGLPEGLIKVTPNYALSTQLNYIHYVAKLNFPLLGKSLSNYMLKSMPYNFDQFDWTKDVLKLPSTPTAIIAFNGRIYAFDENNTYKIEPNNLYIEDTFNGIGCLGQDSAVVTEYGMFYCDINGIYMHDGVKPIDIGVPIAQPNGTQADSFVWSNLLFEGRSAPKMAFDPKRKSILITALADNVPSFQSFIWAYNILKQRWDIITLVETNELNIYPYRADAITAIHVDLKGNILASAESAQAGHFLYKLFASSNKRKFLWRSKKIDMGDISVDKAFCTTTIEFTRKDSSSIGDLEYNIETSKGTIPQDEMNIINSGDSIQYSYAFHKHKKAKWIKHKIFGEDIPYDIDSITTEFTIK